MVARAQRSGLPDDAQAARDLDSMCERFEKKIHDLELTRMISIQTAPQIRMVQGSDTVMTEKIQSTLVNTIPLWKSQMVLALGRGPLRSGGKGPAGSHRYDQPAAEEERGDAEDGPRWRRQRSQSGGSWIWKP